MLQQASPSNPAAGYTKIFFKSGDILYARSSAGVERRVTPGVNFAFSVTGTLIVQTGAHRIYNDTGDTLTIKSVRASVGTAPTGAAILCDVNVDGTTIFSGGTNRPNIAVSTNTNKTTGMSTTTIADGSYFTVDVDQIGSTVAGSNLTVQILCG
jgi:hypothetical protein